MDEDVTLVYVTKGPVADLIERHLDGEFPYSGENSLYSNVFALGYNCRSLYEMVIQAQEARSDTTE